MSAIEHALGEVAIGPSGPRTAAFFDLDGTLIDGFSATRFFQHRLRNREIDAAEIVRTLRLAVDAAVGTVAFEDFMASLSRAFKGHSAAELMAVAEELFDTEISQLLYDDMKEIVALHQAKGHTVVLASSSTSFQAEPVAKALGIDHVVCNRMSVDDRGRLTGEMIEPIVWGPGKAEAAQRLAATLGVDLRNSYFYADGDEDRALMLVVGHPRPVNPGSHLTRIAQRRGWPILNPTREAVGGGGLGKLRLAAGIASLLPAAAVGGGVGLMRRDKRAALNAMLPLWLDNLFRINGVHLKVVAGAEHLEAPRPAVFLFNHRNAWDAFMAMALIRTDVTGVGKQELANDPILGPIGRLMDVAFIDRSDTQSAVAALEGIEDLARGGLSVLIAPEGTRSPDGELQPFKKGPFRIAMSSGLPIVPIVIRNADAVADRESAAMKPGTVEIVVLAPIYVDDWTLEELPERIDEVRTSYLEQLPDSPR